MKIGILTFHNAMNYGAILQCYALQSFVKEHYDCEVRVVDYTPKYFKKVFYDPMKPLSACGIKNKVRACAKLLLRYKEMKNMSKKYRELNSFISRYIQLSHPKESFQDCEFDVYIVGSDQIWNLELLDNDTTYLLDFVGNSKKISYAASFKLSDVDEYAKNAYKKYLSLFDAISVRESNLKDFVIENVGVDAVSVIDPTLLVGKNFWKSFIYEKALIEDEYILIYHVNRPHKLIEKAFEYAQKHNLRVVSLNPLKNYKDYLDYSMGSISDFLNLIANAKVVFTTSFHGMAFAVNYEKDFYFEVPENSYNNNERLLDLARKLNLGNRNISKFERFNEINWDDVRCKLENERRLAREFLDKALKE